MGKVSDFQKAAKKKQKKQEDQLWRALLNCLAAITQMHPWDQLDSGDPFAFIPKSCDRMVFFSCVQDAEDSMGIMVFPSQRDYQLSCFGEISARQMARNYIEMESYSVYFTPREDVPDEMRKIYRRLALDFGDGLWPWVIYKRRGYLGSVPEGEDLAFLFDCLGNFYMQLQAIEKSGKIPDFEHGTMVLRYYSPREELWMNMQVPFELPPEAPHSVILAGTSPKLKELKALGAAADVRKIEFDFGWVDLPQQDNSREEPYYPMQVVFTDRESGRLLSLFHCRPEDGMDCAFSAWSEVLHQYGIPEMLYVCRDESYDLFEDFAHKLGVKIKQVKRLPAAQRILRDQGAV